MIVPYFEGFGTVTNVHFEKRKDKYVIEFNCGTATARQVKISLKDGTILYFDKRYGSAICGYNDHMIIIVEVPKK